MSRDRRASAVRQRLGAALRLDAIGGVHENFLGGGPHCGHVRIARQREASAQFLDGGGDERLIAREPRV